MTGFDYLFAMVMLTSGGFGLLRGATREVTTAGAFTLAVLIASISIRFSAPVAHHFVQATWLANGLGAFCVFLAAYVVLRLLGALATRTVRNTVLSGPDRILGLALGLTRGLVVLGIAAILIEAITPKSRMPHWIGGAATWPVAHGAGGLLKVFAPKGAAMAKGIVPSFGNAVSSGQASPPTDPTGETDR